MRWEGEERHGTWCLCGIMNSYLFSSNSSCFPRVASRSSKVQSAFKACSLTTAIRNLLSNEFSYSWVMTHLPASENYMNERVD